MKTIEEVIRSYKNSISLEPYGLKEFQRHPELQEQIKDVMAEYNIPNFKSSDVSTEGLEKIVAMLTGGEAA